MSNKNNNVKTAGSKLAKILAEQGIRILTRKDATQIAIENGYSESFADKIVLHMTRGGWIEMIRPGLYALNSIFLGGHPIHEFEIISHLVRGAVVSHFSAMHHYGFTDQIPHIQYATVQTGSPLPRPQKGQALLIQGSEYHFTQISERQFFGHKKIWIGETRILITDPERTLLDGLIKPDCCGGFQEVLSAYQKNIDNINLETLVSYALKLNTSIAKRLGWILDQLNVDDELIQSLLDIPFKGYTVLNASGERAGPYNKKWRIQSNL